MKLRVLYLEHHNLTCMISGFLCEVEENVFNRGYYFTSIVHSLPTLRDSLSVPYSTVGHNLKVSLKIGPISCPEMSVSNYHFSLRNNPEERGSHNLTL
jgi:hypothetical protein